jgi:DNA-binding transcriptional MerR regulator
MWNDLSFQLEEVKKELAAMEDKGLQERQKYKQKQSLKSQLLSKVTRLEARINQLYKEHINIFL